MNSKIQLSIKWLVNQKSTILNYLNITSITLCLNNGFNVIKIRNKKLIERILNFTDLASFLFLKRINSEINNCKKGKETIKNSYA